MKPRFPEAVLYVNANSRRGAKWFQKAQAGLQARGMSIRRAELFHQKEPMVAAVRESLAEKEPLIIIGGGDGTFGAVDHDFAHQPSTLGVLPLGTGNAFARDLGIRTNIDHACDTIAFGSSVRADLGLIGDHHFLSVSTIGLSTLIARRLNRRLKKMIGPFAYLHSVWQSLREVQPFDVELTLPGEEAHFRSLQVVLGNGKFHAGPYLLAPDADLTDGKLLIYALDSDRRSELFRLAVAVQFGRHIDLHNVRVWRASSGKIVTNPDKTVTVDGDSILRTPQTFGVAPRALKVMAPLST